MNATCGGQFRVQTDPDRPAPATGFAEASKRLELFIKSLPKEVSDDLFRNATASDAQLTESVVARAACALVRHLPLPAQAEFESRVLFNVGHPSVYREIQYCLQQAFTRQQLEHADLRNLRSEDDLVVRNALLLARYVLYPLSESHWISTSFRTAFEAEFTILRRGNVGPLIEEALREGVLLPEPPMPL